MIMLILVRLIDGVLTRFQCSVNNLNYRNETMNPKNLKSYNKCNLDRN